MSTKEQEAQQAQTVADRKKRDAESWERYLHEQSRSYPEDLLDIDHGAYRNDCSTCGKPFQGFKRRFTCRVCEIANLKAIVDSQAQKIAEQAEEIERLKEQVKVNARQVHDAAQLKL